MKSIVFMSCLPCKVPAHENQKREVAEIHGLGLFVVD